MVRNSIGLITGLVVAYIIIFLIQMTNYQLFPFPPGLSSQDSEAMKEYAASLPAMAFIVVIVAHAVGSMAGSWMACKIADHSKNKLAIGIGAFLMLMGLVNILSFSHPVWFIIIDLAIFIPSAWIGYQISEKIKSPI